MCDAGFSGEEILIYSCVEIAGSGHLTPAPTCASTHPISTASDSPSSRLKHLYGCRRSSGDLSAHVEWCAIACWLLMRAIDSTETTACAVDQSESQTRFYPIRALDDGNREFVTAGASMDGGGPVSNPGLILEESATNDGLENTDEALRTSVSPRTRIPPAS